MRLTNIILVIAGIACIGFAYWGLFTRSGFATYQGMDGFIPFGVGVLGVLLWILAVLLALYNFFVTPSERPFPNAPKYSDYYGWILLSAALIIVALFELFCRFTVGVSGILIAISWFDGEGYHWGMTLLFMGVLFVHVLFVGMTIIHIHTRYFGQLESSIVLGYDLHNEVFRLYPSDKNSKSVHDENIVTAGGGLYEDGDVFLDRFKDLRWEKGLRYGQRAQDVSSWKSFTPKAANTAGAFHCLTLGFLGLFFIGLIGWSLDYQGNFEIGTGTPVEIGFAWLWGHHSALFVATILVGFGTVIFLATQLHDPELVKRLQPDEVYAPLPEMIRPDKIVHGIVVDYATEHSSSEHERGFRISHHNALVRIDKVFPHPVWLRISLDNIQLVRAWLEKIKTRDGIPESFIVLEDLSIMPLELHRKRAGVDGE